MSAWSCWTASLWSVNLKTLPTRPPSAPLRRRFVEIADTTLSSDRRKGSLYARAGVPEYWIVNLADDVLEVYRRPATSESSRFGWTYSERQVLRRGDVVTPLAAPGGHVAVDNLLP